jgi:hypothetical protein
VGVKVSGVNRYYFEQSNGLHDEIISLHDFILPAGTALWNFRQTISSEIAASPDIGAAELAKRYNKAPGSRGTTNLLVAFRDISWEDQRERLAEIALVNIVALYEIWCDAICEQLGDKDLSVKLQFPTDATRSSGVGFALDQLLANQNSSITGSIYPALIRSKKYSLLSLDNLLKCFRYFKELRN